MVAAIWVLTENVNLFFYGFLSLRTVCSISSGNMENSPVNYRLAHGYYVRMMTK